MSGAFSLLGIHPEGFEFDLVTGGLVQTFNAENDGFIYPHDLAVSKDGKYVYEIELNPFMVYKFVDTRLKKVDKRKLHKGILN